MFLEFLGPQISFVYNGMVNSQLTDSFKTIVSSTALGTWDTLTRCHFLFSSWAFIQELVGGVEKIISGKVGEMILVAMWVASAWKKNTD